MGNRRRAVDFKLPKQAARLDSRRWALLVAGQQQAFFVFITPEIRSLRFTRSSTFQRFE
jgi:hypothetical protein